MICLRVKSIVEGVSGMEYSHLDNAIKKLKEAALEKRPERSNRHLLESIVYLIKAVGDLEDKVFDLEGRICKE